MKFERSGNIKKTIKIGHQAINLKYIWFKLNKEKTIWLSNKDTHEFLKEISARGFLPWWVINRNLSRNLKEGDSLEFILIDEDVFKLNENKEKVYITNKLSYIAGKKVIFRGELYQIPKTLTS